MLPEDTRERREAMQSLQQSAVDEHFKPVAPEDKPIAYSDKFFMEAAIEWLIETNQVRQTITSLKFINSFYASLSKHSSTQNSRKWSTSLHVLLVASSIPPVNKLGKPLSQHSRSR